MGGNLRVLPGALPRGRFGLYFRRGGVEPFIDELLRVFHGGFGQVLFLLNLFGQRRGHLPRLGRCVTFLDLDCFFFTGGGR